MLKKLLMIMETEKPYTESELIIHQLAAKLGISSHHLSQIINEQLKQNFADFINSYRIKEAQLLLAKKEYEREKKVSIAFESCYSNKVTFNAAFKKYTGMAPSDYRQKVLKDSIDTISLQ